MRTFDFIAGVTGLALVVVIYMHLQLKLEVGRVAQKGYSDSVQNSATHAKIVARLDSVDKKNAALARSIVYLDSCNQVKTSKADRAEKRGRFIGGLLKGLFPGM